MSLEVEDAVVVVCEMHKQFISKYHHNLEREGLPTNFALG